MDGKRSFIHFGRIAQILLWSLSPFMVFLDKISLHITLLTILLFDTTLMTSRVQIPFERTHRESCAFDVGTLDTGLVHVSHPPQVNLHAPSLRIGRTTSLSQSRLVSRFASHTMSVDPEMTRAIPCMANT